VSLIGRSDFPDKWPELLPNLVAKLSTDNFDVINGVMQTANSLFKRYGKQAAVDYCTAIISILTGGGGWASFGIFANLNCCTTPPKQRVFAFTQGNVRNQHGAM
jgi:hypothetical protein